MQTYNMRNFLNAHYSIGVFLTAGYGYSVAIDGIEVTQQNAHLLPDYVLLPTVSGNPFDRVAMDFTNNIDPTVKVITITVFKLGDVPWGLTSTDEA